MNIICDCKVPIPWNEKFGIYICMNCGSLADKDGNIPTLSKEDKNNFIQEIKIIQKKLIDLSLKESQIRNNKD